MDVFFAEDGFCGLEDDFLVQRLCLFDNVVFELLSTNDRVGVSGCDRLGLCHGKLLLERVDRLEPVMNREAGLGFFHAGFLSMILS